MLAVLLIAFAALTRLMPHAPNFTAVGAMALFGGAYLSRKYAFVVPFLALWISDVLLNNIVYKQYYPTLTLLPTTWAVTYLPMLLVVGLGLLMRNEVSTKNVIFSSLASAFVFFLVSNFFVWTGSSVFPQNPVGLMLCYEAGLPFLKNQILGDLLFSGLLFGGYEFAQRKVLKLV